MKTITHEQGKLANPADEPVAFDVIDLGPFQHNHNDLKAMNDHGQAVGISLNTETGRVEGFLEERGQRTSLGTLGGSFSVAHDINDRGEIVGGSLTEGNENFHGFLYRNHRLYDLNQLLKSCGEWELIQAVAINNHGEVLGIGAHLGEDRLVLLKPRPVRSRA